MTQINNKQKTDKENGISLIVLVITIIVLLILIGVTLAVLTGDSGILNNAESAKENTTQSNTKEQVLIAVQGALVEGFENTIITRENLTTELNKIVGNKKYYINDSKEGPWEIQIDEYKATIYSNGEIVEKPKEAGKRFEKDETITIAGKKVTIPKGFTLSAATGEYEEIEDGIVIYLIPKGTIVNWGNPEELLEVQKKYDQFVWTPVSDVIAVDMNNDKILDTTDINLMIEADRYPMAIANGINNDGSTKYRAVLYDFSLSSDGTKVEISDKTYFEDSGNCEPAYLNDFNADANTTFNNVGIQSDTLQLEFNTMVEKVKTNGGFWVGRYETSHMLKGTAENTSLNDFTNRVTIIKGTSTGVSDEASISDGTGLNWYRMYAQQKNYASLALGETTKTSNMIWGSQWDQVMVWMRNVENTNKSSLYVVNSLSMGNFRTSDDTDTNISGPTLTGNSENYKVKNIYDLAGNLYEWTQEALDGQNRVRRGGYYRTRDANYARADVRASSSIVNGEVYGGSRATLY